MSADLWKNTSGKRKPTSVAKVSYWVIPGGYDYTNAYACVVYFDDMEQAKAFEKEYDRLPEMALLVPLEESTA